MNYILWIQVGGESDIRVVAIPLGKTLDEAREKLDKIYELRDLVLDHKLSEARWDWSGEVYALLSAWEPSTPSSSLEEWQMQQPLPEGGPWLITADISIDELEQQAFLETSQELFFSSGFDELCVDSTSFWFSILPRKEGDQISTRCVYFDELEPEAKKLNLLYPEDD